MNHDLAAAMRRATRATLAQDLAGATAAIQAALSGRDAGRPAGFAPGASAGAIRRPRLPLGDAVKLLREGRRGLPEALRPAGAPELPIPEGAAFLRRSFACAAGGREYRLYVPASAADGPDGLVVMLHGCTQTPEDFAAGTGMNDLAEAHRLIVAYPRQTRGENAMSCWNWFRPGDQARDLGEPAVIAGLTRSLVAEFGVPEDRVFVAGLSAGGAMAAVMGATYPDLFAAIGVHSGLAHGAATDVATAFAAMRGEAGLISGGVNDRSAGTRVIVFHGSADGTVHPSNAERIVAGPRRAAGGAVRSERGASGGGRGYRRTVVDGGDGRPAVEDWLVEGAGHAWSGGRAAGSYTDPEGPDASAEMVRFFLAGAAS